MTMETTRRTSSRQELLERWKKIEEEEREGEDYSGIDSSMFLHHLQRTKELWFVDAFNLLICLHKENHIWCDFDDIMGPLLETFYNYRKDECPDSPLRLLWKRMSGEMKACVRCISQHHQAQHVYSSDYELDFTVPLLNVLRGLDVERVTQHLKDFNNKIMRREFLPAHDNDEVVAVIFEVLMCPILLDDHLLFTEFEVFVESIDSVHELTLDGHQQLPGVYALFFFKRRVRSVAHRLAASLGKLRRAVDLEPLQFLLKKFIGLLEADVMPSSYEISEPLLQQDRSTAWIGIKSLLGFLEPPALEEGILERYPIFLDIVLHHISGDCLAFCHAVSCLKLLFEMLGCKLWLRSNLSPCVMRSTLLGQCFHTRSEKIHKDIFDLFHPLLQSLEPLEDGELEKQRRNLLYFLLHQVPVSSNFSVLTRQKARQIAFLIIHRGYWMCPPCPPFECSHMWGPSLISSIKDPSLHPSLRQPALDLIQTIIVADATALVSVAMTTLARHTSDEPVMELTEIEDDELLQTPSITAEDNAWLWNAFSLQEIIVSRDFEGWLSIPVLWVDVLVQVDVSLFPISFCKAVLWARSCLSFIEPVTSVESSVHWQDWLSSSAPDILASFGWKVPTGCDDGSDKKLLKNSVEVANKFLLLIKVFNRLSADFIQRIGHQELQEQWSWEPSMGKSLIILLADPNDNVRRVAKCILEHVSNTRGLANSLKFLCSDKASLSAVYSGLKHALKIVLNDSHFLKYQTLQHFLFLLRKLLSEGKLHTGDVVKHSNNDLNVGNLSSQGGFLQQTGFRSSPVIGNASLSCVDHELYNKFCHLLSKAMWPSMQLWLMAGKSYLNSSSCQMTCVRILELLPILLKELSQSIYRSLRSAPISNRVWNYKWLQILIDWGQSSLDVVVVYWKKTMIAVLALFKVLFGGTSSLIASEVENLINADSMMMDELTGQASRLCVSLSKETSGVPSISCRNSTGESLESEIVLEMRDPKRPFISYEEKQEHIPQGIPFIHTPDQSGCILAEEKVISLPDKVLSEVNNSIEDGDVHLSKDFPATPLVIDGGEVSRDMSLEKKKRHSNLLSGWVDVPLPKSNGMAYENSRNDSDCNIKDLVQCQDGDDKKISYSKNFTVEHKYFKKNLEADKQVLKQFVHSVKDQAQISTGRSLKPIPTSLMVSNVVVPKRKVIQLKSLVQNRAGYPCKLQNGNRRFVAPRLDEWYRPIFEMDYFTAIGESSGVNFQRNSCNLREIPLCFQSEEEYVNIFRPLVMEEFKAQLRSSYLEMSSLEDLYCGNVSVLSVDRIDDFHLVRFLQDSYPASAISLSENDLILLTKEPVQSACHEIHMLGKVERRERDHKRKLSIVTIRFYLQSSSSRLNKARRLLIERSKWYGSRIMSITPQLREFQALSSFNSIPLLDKILNPTGGSDCYESRRLDLGKMSRPLQRVLESSFNESQLQAIATAVSSLNTKDECQLSLIQGPPGTGKTRTIVAIVSAFLASLQRKSAATSCSHDDFRPNGTADANVGAKMKEAIAIGRVWQDAAFAQQLNKISEGDRKFKERDTGGRVLVCAQSNAAVDELVSRIYDEGLIGRDGKVYKPYLVRVGNIKTVHPSSFPCFIDTLVDQRLAKGRNLTNNASDISLDSTIQLRAKLEKLVDRIRLCEARHANPGDGNSDNGNTLGMDPALKRPDIDLEVKLKELYDEKKQLYKELTIAQAHEKKADEATRTLKTKLRKSILIEAEIVVTTLSGCGGDLYDVCSESMVHTRSGNPSEHALFDAVIIDEAAQALEPASLIPLQLLKSRRTSCVMVGDPKQLPATVVSSLASKFLYECSMFERLQRAGHPVTMLTKQYRMHPEISRFPSLYFYDGKLLNGETINRRSSFHDSRGFSPYIFYDVLDGVECRGKNSGSFSLWNEQEIDATISLLSSFKKRYPAEFVGGRVGIITPYKRQLSLLRSHLVTSFGSSVVSEMELNTVDGFQGREVDILILSTVRAVNSLPTTSNTSSSSIGFVSDVRRMNVALTRAKFALWILGHSRTLKTNRSWAALLDDANARKVVIPMRKPYSSMFESASGSESTEKCNSSHSENCREVVDSDSQPGGRTKKKNSKSIHKKQYIQFAVPSGGTDAVERLSLMAGDKHDSSMGERYPSAGVKSEIWKTSNIEHADARKAANKVRDKKDEYKTEGGKKLSEFKSSANARDSGADMKGKDSSTKGRMKRNYYQERASSSGKGKDVDGNNYKQLIPQTKSSELDKHPRNYDGPNLFKDWQKGTNAKDSRSNSHIVHKQTDLITKRKQQRLAVEGILSSSLLHSKELKAPVKLLSGKRSLPRVSIVGSGIQSAKRRKAPTKSS